jgi:Flp pilus assembly pilin Flp
VLFVDCELGDRLMPLRTVYRSFCGMLVCGERAEAGNALPEYAVVLTFLSIAAMVALIALGTAATHAFDNFGTNLNTYDTRHA